MAELFGIATGAAGLADVAFKIGHGLFIVTTRMKHAPGRILALSNETKDFRTVLMELLNYAQAQSPAAAESQPVGTPNNGDQRTKILALLEAELSKARTVLGGIDKLVTKLLSEHPMMMRIKWTAKEDDAKELQQKLRDVRRTIVELLVAYNGGSIQESISISKRVELEVCGIRLEMQQGRATLGNHIESSERSTGAIVRQTASQTQDHVSARLGDLEASLLNEMAGQHREYLAGLSEIRDVNEQVNQALARMETSMVSMSRQPEDMANLVIDILCRMSTEETNRQIVPRSFGSAGAVVPKAAHMPRRDSFSTNDSGSGQPFSPPHASPLELNSILYITLGRRSACGSGCPCACHAASRQRSWQLPNFVRNVLGSLFVGYAASPVSPAKCDVDRCAKDRRKRLTVTYAFPLWFLNYVVRGVLETSTAGSATLGLVTCRRVPQYMASTNILWSARIGAVHDVRDILRENSAAILDVDLCGGHSVLHLALSTHPDWPTQLSVLQCLLAAGADPDFPDDNGETPRHWVAHQLLFAREESCSDLERLFPRAEGIEGLELTYLHEIVLGLCRADLTETLRSRDPAIRSQVNTGDMIGWTPLMYAARLGNKHHVRALLDAGADVNARNNIGRTALFTATSDIADLLLSAGADANITDKVSGGTAVHKAARGDDTGLIERLITAGANIHQRDEDGMTPLHITAYSNSSDALSLLYEMGADPDTCDVDGETPLMTAIAYNAHDALRTLLEIEADHLRRDCNGSSFLDFTAEYADVETMRTLARSNLDISAWNDIDLEFSKTWCRFANRKLISYELHEAFVEFMDSLKTGLEDDRSKDYSHENKYSIEDDRNEDCNDDDE
ncbi:hypothetical protein VTJ49DRAFT_5581 [Mycothermus thermophilus]|uniref:Ankyrin repeat protein n=1 Tax=Humicola insolens TaxID=85995 RepID=A0ABR3VKI9_HUMIN